MDVYALGINSFVRAARTVASEGLLWIPFHLAIHSSSFCSSTHSHNTLPRAAVYTVHTTHTCVYFDESSCIGFSHGAAAATYPNRPVPGFGYIYQ